MKRRASRKQTKAIGDGDKPPTSVVELSTRIFLYLQPKAIHYPMQDENVTVDIELQHPEIVITMLKDHYTPKNIIYLDEYQTETPTFTVTIKQDDIEDVNRVSDTPLQLTLYENVSQPLVREKDTSSLMNSEQLENEYENEDMNATEEAELVIIERRAVAQGYIDILEFFSKQRTHVTCTSFLYPLPNSPHHLTCKIEWEIYSLHPLIKTMILSNVLFLTLGAVYNLDEALMDDCDDVTLRLSLVSTVPNEHNQVDKIYVCSFKGFLKQILDEQVINNKWESLKSTTLANNQSMGIKTDSKLNVHKLFVDLLSTEGCELNLDEIDISSEYSLICNSLHRYILNDCMEQILEASLACNRHRLLIELSRERDVDRVLLQGFVELAVFMYPNVTSCSFAIELRPPGYKKPTLPTPKDDQPKSKKKGKNTENPRKSMASTHEMPKEKIPFVTVKICLSKPITEPVQDMIHAIKPSMKQQIFNKCPHNKHRTHTLNLNEICEDNYRNFDESIQAVVDYVVQNEIKTVEDDQKFYCSQLGNMTNKIIRLVACDFNERLKTQTNIEFTNLMTLVYQELGQRIYEILRKCNTKNIDYCISRTESDRLKIINRFNIIKLMTEVGDVEMADFFTASLSEEYPNSCILAFYKFLYHVEKENFTLAREYLNKPLNEKDMEGQMFIDIITIYINFKENLKNAEHAHHAIEHLLHALTQSSQDNPQNISTWILLYCLYKTHNYLPGVEYCRWKYENLYRTPWMELPRAPISRWDIYLAHKPELKPQKAKHFIEIINLFLSLGLYQFAEWIFDEIGSEAMEVERYFMYSTFKIFLNKLEDKFTAKMFPVEKYLNPLYLRAALNQVNGNLEYFRNSSSPAAIKFYSSICDLKDLPNHENLNLALLRYSFYMMEAEEYAKAKDAYSLCCSNQGYGIVAAIGKGRACYKLDDLQGAKDAFAQCTRYGFYIPKVWAYLALINLRDGDNYKALECWKYARLNPNDDIHREILQELNKINYRDVDLYIDIPERKTI